MSAVPLIPDLIQPLMQLITMVAIGLDPTVDASAKAVRVGWQRTGQPASSIDENVCYVRATEEDDLYNKIRDEAYTDILPEPSEQIQVETTYTRVWRVFWTFYGPDSFDHARKLKSALFKQTIHDMLLGAYNTYGQLPMGLAGFGGNSVALYLVTELAAPTRVPEDFGGQWWERVDFSCQFNEGVVEDDIINAVASTEIIIETAEGIQTDEIVYTGNPPPLPVPPGSLEEVTLTPTANPMVFTLPYIPRLLLVFRGGLKQDEGVSDDYQLTANIVTFASIPTGVLSAYAEK